MRAHWKVLLAAGILAGCSAIPASPRPTAELRAVHLPMGYIPNVQFAPFYVAEDKGYFREEGLRPEFDYSLETEAVTQVGVGDVSFALVSGEQVLLARAQGLPVVYVLAWFQDYPIGVAAPASAGWTSPADIAGKRIGIPGLFGASYVGYRALLAAAGLPENAAQLDAIGFTQVDVLLAGQEDGVVVYANNEPILLEASGMPVDVLRVADYVKLASNGLITNETMIRDHPDLVQAMVRAIVRGITETIADPEEAFDVSTGFVPGMTEADAQVQKRVLYESLGYWQADRIGTISADAWDNMEKVLLDMGLLAAPVDPRRAFADQFVP